MEPATCSAMETASVVEVKCVSNMSSEEEEEEAPAYKWPCGPCGCLLGVLHLIFAISILGLDVATEHIAYSAFPTTAGLTFMLTAILCFISVRRLDRCAQLLLLGCCSFSLIISIAIFLESGAVLNQLCPVGQCSGKLVHVLMALISISLSEGAVCLATLFVCYRSLRNAYVVLKANSPYSTIVVGDYRTLIRRPRLASEAPTVHSHV